MGVDEEKIATYVRGILERDRLSADAFRERARFRPESVADAPGGLSSQDVEALRKVEQHQELTIEERFRLEAVVVPNGLRPSFDVVHDTFEMLPAMWAEVNARRGALEPLLKGIGRLNLNGHPQLRFVGTAFAVAQDVLLTNRHVAEFFVDNTPEATLHFKPGLSSVLDLKEEVGVPDSIPVRVRAPIAILNEWDAALLRVEPLPAGVQPLPLAGEAPAAIEGRLAVVVGYPAMDPAADLIQQIQIFRGVFDKKRMTPGRLMGLKSTTSFERTVSALGHDCTTLGGNSGSAVIDVSTGTVVGLHFAGDQFVANYAVPSWGLAREATVTAAGVTFV